MYNRTEKRKIIRGDYQGPHFENEPFQIKNMNGQILNIINNKVSQLDIK